MIPMRGARRHSQQIEKEKSQGFDKYECAEQMLRMANGGKSPVAIQKALKGMGYSSEQIAEAGQVLIDANS